jgi:hypothetical protein
MQGQIPDLLAHLFQWIVQPGSIQCLNTVNHSDHDQRQGQNAFALVNDLYLLINGRDIDQGEKNLHRQW